MSGAPPGDRIYIRGLAVETIVGVFPWEREVPQRLSLDLEIATDIRPAAASDQLPDTLDYKALSKRLCAFIAQSRFQLLESLAEKTAALILEEFGVSWVRLRLSKPGALRDAENVGLIIERSA